MVISTCSSTSLADIVELCISFPEFSTLNEFDDSVVVVVSVSAEWTDDGGRVSKIFTGILSPSFSSIVGASSIADCKTGSFPATPPLVAMEDGGTALLVLGTGSLSKDISTDEDCLTSNFFSDTIGLGPTRRIIGATTEEVLVVGSAVVVSAISGVSVINAIFGPRGSSFSLVVGAVGMVVVTVVGVVVATGVVSELVGDDCVVSFS